VLAGVDEGERHGERVGEQQRPPPAAHPAEEEDNDEQRERRVQRRHRRHRVGRDLAGVEHVSGAVQPDRLPSARRDAGDLWQQAVPGCPPRRRGRVGEVRDQPEDRQGEPASHEGRPPRPVAQPQHHRDGERDDEVREVDPARDDVPPVDAVRVVEVLLQPDGGDVPVEQEPVGLDQLDRVRSAALVGEAAREVVEDEQQGDRQPVAGEPQVHAPRLVDADGDRREPEPPEGQQRVGEWQPEQHPPGDEADRPDRQCDDPLARRVGVGRAGRVGLAGGHRHQG